jgi:hypothetical protein
MKPSTLGIAVWVGASFVVGCASNLPPPNDQWAAAQADLGRAQAGGAPQVPDAKLHLQLAEEDLQKSHQLMGDNNNRATTLCALARTEAQLALSLAKQASAQDQAMKAQGDLQSTGNPNSSTNVNAPSTAPTPIAPSANPNPMTK